MILITGATSENGSEIVRRLSAANARVRAMVRSPGKKEDRAMRQTISIPIEHRVVASDWSYQAEITLIAQLVEQKLEALVAEVTGGGEGKEP